MPKHIAEGIQMTVNANIILNGGKVTGLLTPSANSDIATVKYANDYIVCKEIAGKPYTAGVSIGDYAGQVLTNASSGIEFFIPMDFVSLVELSIIAVGGSTSSGTNGGERTDYGAVGETYNNHAYTGSYSFNIVPNRIYSFDFSAAVANLAAGDLLGTYFSVPSGYTMYLIGGVMRYL